MELLQDVQEIIYLDSAATVYPKPKEILEKAMKIYGLYGVNPGRSGYDLCMVGGNLVQETREKMAKFFGGSDPSRLCFTYNASDSLNLLIYGLLDKGDHAISTNLEHNSVIRPLNHFKRDLGVDVDFLKFGSDGRIDPDDLKKAIRKNTKLVVVNHGSNVIGAVQPVAEIGRICRDRGICFVVDTAQTAGVVPIDVEEMCIDALAFTGHKSLLGPTGIGGLYVREGIEIKHTRAGGTGVKSAYPYHLEEYPYRLEVGTGNLLGILGLLKAQDYLEEHNINKIFAHEMELFSVLHNALGEIDGVTLHGTTSLESRLPVLSLTIEGLDPADVGTMLDVDYNIATRTGLQCAPLVHRQMGTDPRGTVRMSVGPMNNREHIDAAITATREIAAYALKK